MKKTLSLSFFLVFISSFVFTQTTVNLGIDDGGATCGACTASCDPVVCTGGSTTGNCPSAESASLMIPIPANSYLDLTIVTNTCGSTSGLDGGDNIVVNGAVVVTGSGNLIVNYSDCYASAPATAGSLTITLTANRRDETVDVTYQIFSGDNGGACSMLPVTLTSFNARKISDQDIVKLDWTTASEINNDYFAIQHSLDGITYNEIDFIAGAGSSMIENKYQYTHRTPAKGSNYYRLTQVDFNRRSSHSEVLVVDIAKAELFSLQPTIAKAEITLSFDKKLSPNTTVEVYDLAGRSVFQDQINKPEINWTLKVADFQNGHYFVRIQNAGQVQTARFIKN